MVAMHEHGIDKDEVTNFILYVSLVKDGLNVLKKVATKPPHGWDGVSDRMWFTHATEKAVERLVKILA
jgi:hypothetical protein